MTTQAPTSNELSVPAGLPNNFPDEATLGRLASEFFAALPGSFPSGGSAPPGLSGVSGLQLPSSPPAGATSVLASPGVSPAASPLPEATPNAQHTLAPTAAAAPQLQPLPSTPQPAAPTAPAAGTDSLAIGNVPLGGFTPEFAAAVPSVTPPVDVPGPVSPPSSPYYFLGESSAYPSRTENALPYEDRVTPQAFGLPGESELKQLLGKIDTGRNEPAASNGPGGVAHAPANTGGYYFLEQSGNPAAAAPSAKSTTPAVPAASEGRRIFDVDAIRRDFPILAERVNGKQLVWFDNAATTHKPQSVIDRLAYFYAHENSNIHRAAHELAARATDAYESARNKVTRFLGAQSSDEIIFVRGATEAINLVAKTWGWQNIGEGDEIIVSLLEHHANIVPWQQLAAAKGARIRVIPVDNTGQILLDEFRKLLNDKTKLVSITQVSNALGTITPVKEVIDIAHRAGAVVLVDGAQAVSHVRVDVQALDADFYVFSGHKVFGPTGIGVVYGKKKILDDMPPWQGGGNMIADVTFERTLYQGAPARFEAGTGNIADAVGLGAAIDYVQQLGLENIARYEHDLLEYATHYLRGIPGVRLIGTAQNKASVASFVLDGYRTEDVGAALNREGIAVRSGHHCAQPILRRFGVEATVRPSLAFYNTCEEVDRMIAVVKQLARKK